MSNLQKLNFNLGLVVVGMLISTCLSAQDIRYSISVPNGVRGAAKELPDSIDSNHYYSYQEIRKHAEPTAGWDAFYHEMDSLNYPDEAKKLKIQSSMTVAYKINEFGGVDSVYIHDVDSYGRWKECHSCEMLMIEFLKNTEWTPGKVGEIPVKSIDYLYVRFSIYDPNSKRSDARFENDDPFGY